MGGTTELGLVVTIQAEAIGVPGQRRFRLRAMNADSVIGTIWLEKEQLNALGEALETTLRDEGYRFSDGTDDIEEDAVLPLPLGTELQAAQLSMGLQRDGQRIVLTGSDGTPGDEDVITISAELSFQRAYRLRRQITAVVSAGRPLCPLCTAPMDTSGHVCVRTNGYHPH